MAIVDDSNVVFFMEVPYGRNFFIVTNRYLVGLGLELVKWRTKSHAYSPKIYEVEASARKYPRVSKKDIIDALKRSGFEKEAKIFKDRV